MDIQVKYVVFVPATRNSKLRDILQHNDDKISEMLNAPSLRFVEKGGRTVLDKLGQSDPWKAETFCNRQDCLHCEGWYIIAQEEEDKAMAKVSGGPPRSSPPKGTSVSLPGCTTEGITYSLDCLTLRQVGTRGFI